MTSKSKPTKRRKQAKDEEDVAVDSDAERLAEVQAMLEEIDRVSESSEKEEDPFPETLVDPAPPQEEEDEAQGDQEQEEEEPEGNEEQEEDESQGNEEQDDDDEGDAPWLDTN